jgi:hypothetical protein
MKREFSEILKWKTKPHDALLIPDSFVYGGIAAKVNNLINHTTKGCRSRWLFKANSCMK